MKNTTRKILTLILSVALVCLLAVSALATAPNPISEREDFDNGRYLVTFDASLTGARASASLAIYDEDTGYFVTNTYRYVKIEYSYYPKNGTQGLVSASASKTSPATDICSVSVSTSSNTNIYLIRYAQFSFAVDVPTSNGTRRYSCDYDRLEYIP
jgi:hypothetical protein